MSNIDKQANQVSRYDLVSGYMQKWPDGEFVYHSDYLALLDELEAKDRRIAELEASHGKLREAMAGIHNTIRGEGAYTPLAAILNASKRAYEESAAAAGKGE
ncbi:hypothetical protein [Enterobacter roggenkampii]|uniref:hypothetical protein n=1 Tax=Enterobacter roggenkampii TaxID=1812935 RepID=UPI0020053C03|nr:hypothetical protein [Enterobacter roggenkampii]MCK7200074.1 hypothetical protein [Enterobacter roggenkampii]